jgi:FtsP/CotA-like multicopper oxidase with cupredoxin domain
MEMNRTIYMKITVPIIFAAMLLMLVSVSAYATIDGIIGTSSLTVDLTAKADHISTPDGGSVLIWGYADDNNNLNNGSRATYPGPTLIVDEGAIVTFNLKNELPVPVSMIFPGQSTVTTTGGNPGIMTAEVPANDPTAVVTYTFTASQPGTYLYQSGTSPELQIEMGLVGAFIVRPNAGADHAYNHADAQFDHEYLFMVSEMDPNVHQLVEFQGANAADLTASDYLSDYFPMYWFINGRNAPDTMLSSYVSWLPTQPYNCMPRMHPGDRMLMRMISAGRAMHPFHYHGNHARIIARDGRMLSSAPGAGADLSFMAFTTNTVPGSTHDQIFEWTGKGLGWDMYGHSASDPMQPDEYAADHGKPFPVTLPEKQNMAFGGFYSGSPYLGSMGSLPPGEGGLNPNSGFAYMWHSHTEKEMTNFDIFPGGMMTMMIIEPHGVSIP